MTRQELDEWVRASLDYLTATSTPPRQDAAGQNETSTEEEP